ncbi:YbaB/EbfC family nucleoid-associated protein [Actinoplanes sp. NPDC020271]|uniref:YbaB/EbfC family nucleoid-associated protein n=1 Tax=Actinoplanes sp. NPDC020271 TaxID=3363896 RepID=UPI00379D3FCB
MHDADAAEEWLDSWVAGVDAQASRTVELSRRVAALTSSARSRDGSITVTVGSAGQLQSLDLDDSALRTNGADLSRLIMTLIGQAQAQLSEQVTEQVRQTVGLDTETGQAVVHSYATRFPAPADEQRHDRRAW